MNILYRVYEKDDENTRFYGNHDNIINQEVCICDSREQFKDIMRSMYGPDIKFANSKKLSKGALYIIVISENCYNVEEYVAVEDCKCAYCNRDFKTTPRRKIKLGNLWSLSKVCEELSASRTAELTNMSFCSEYCRMQKEKELEKEFRDFAEEHDILPDEYICRESFSQFSGYIYKITKKSTGEFYIGQTKYNPIFRWGQHLKTLRFDMKNIDDYIFEVIEKVPNDFTSLHTRESYWINKGIEENHDLCLNLQIPNEDNWKEKEENNNVEGF